MYGAAGGKTIEDMIREGTFSSFATQLCFQKFKKIKIYMSFLQRVKQMLGDFVIKLGNIIYGFDH